MKKDTKKLLIGSAITAVGAATLSVLYYCSTKYLMKLALDREGPKRIDRNKEKMISSGDISEIMKNVLESGEKLEKSDLEQVEITAFDGTVLVGHWYFPENPKRIIVAMHGWRSTWERDFGIIAPFWFENDCAVLFAEQRGQGNSGGDCMGFGLLERYDCLDWVKWVNERTECKLPVYLAGLSMGATTVLMAAGLDLPENVCGVAADCGFTSPNAIWKHVSKNSFRVPYGIYSGAARELCKRKINENANYSTTEALQNCKVPVLFIHGTDDNFVPVEMTYENYKACKSEKRLFIVPGAEHGMSYLSDKKGYEETVEKFWKDTEKNVSEILKTQ